MSKLTAAPSTDNRPPDRLRQFLAALRAAMPSDSIDQQTERISKFLEKARPLLRQVAQQRPLHRPSVQLDGTRLTAFLSAIKEPMDAARLGGAFINVWKIAGLRRNELRNAAVLAWLLDPHGSHGLNERVLRALLKSIAAKSTENRWADADLSHGVTVQTEECPLGNRENRVDISISGPDFVLFLEVKIDAPEGDRQLERYVDSARAKALALRKNRFLVLYLSPRLPSGPGASEVVPLTWADIDRVLREVARVQRENPFGAMIARQFADHVVAFS